MKSHSAGIAGRGLSADLSRRLTKVTQLKQPFVGMMLTLAAMYCLIPTISAAEDAVHASQEEWVTKSASVEQLSNMTANETKSMAFELLQQKFVAHYGESFVANQMTSIFVGGGDRTRNRVSNILQRSRGKILDMDEPVYTTSAGKENHQNTIWTVTGGALVVEDTTQPDLNFSMRANLNREVYREGERMYFEVKVTQDCYLTIFAFYQDLSMALVYPANPGDSNRIGKGEDLIIPPLDCGWEMEARLGPGQRSMCEGMIVVATKEPVPFLPDEDEGTLQGFSVVKNYGIREFLKWIGPIPINKSTQVITSYEIHKK